MICANCGSELSGDANFCANCGAQIVLEPVVETVSVAESVQEAEPIASGLSDYCRGKSTLLSRTN